MERDSVRKWWRRHKRRLGDGQLDAWADLQSIIGRERRLPIVVRHDADTGPDERNLEKFNLPSAPLVLLATPKAQEGIDLHHYCRHVVLFDLTWNPAAMEQRIGRVHRLGGSRGVNEKVIVVYCYQKGTYEQVMAARVQQRCEMMRILLGAARPRTPAATCIQLLAAGGKYCEDIGKNGRRCRCSRRKLSNR